MSTLLFAAMEKRQSAQALKRISHALKRCCGQTAGRLTDTRFSPGGEAFWDALNLPQFDGHFKMYTLEVEGVSNEKRKPIHTRV